MSWIIGIGLAVVGVVTIVMILAWLDHLLHWFKRCRGIQPVSVCITEADGYLYEEVTYSDESRLYFRELPSMLKHVPRTDSMEVVQEWWAEKFPGIK